MSIPIEYVASRELLLRIADQKELCDVILVSGIDKQK